MKTAADLCSLVVRFVAMASEPEWLEFKGNNKDPEKIGELVSGLANSAALHRQERAYIVWGIDDATHAIVGTTFRPRQMKVSGQDLEHFLATQLTPHTNIIVHDNLVINSKVVVAFEIEPARTAPIAFCEERGSGIDKVVKTVELWQLPPPDFRIAGDNTVACLYAPRTFAKMTKNEKIRACFQHAQLLWVSGQPMTNESLRKRLGIGDSNYPMASGVIKECLEANLIKSHDPVNASKRYARYVPFWA